MRITVNDTSYDVDVPARKTLADVLREDCGLTGTHIGCEQGVCGSCTVLCDGEPVRACLLFAVQCAGVRIRTVEGLAADDGALHPVQEAFRRHGALQCGFCTPGFLMLLAGALAGPGGQRPGGQRPGGQRPGGQRPGGQRPGGQRPGGQRPGGQQLDDERLREIVSSNLCRCTGYRPILAAAREAVSLLAAAPGFDADGPNRGESAAG
jgi:carbon-monoxide dehydrogenase small subunit